MTAIPQEKPPDTALLAFPQQGPPNAVADCATAPGRAARTRPAQRLAARLTPGHGDLDVA
jgi:hypothetical protein